MAGLLSMLDNPGAQLGLGLLAAAGPSPVPMSFGQRAAGAIGQFQAQQRAEREAKAQEAIRELQAKMLQAQMMEREQAAARQKTDSGILRNLAIGAPADGMGPPQGAPRIDPQAFLAGGGSLEGLPSVLQLQAALTPKQRELMTVAPGASLVDPRDPTKPLFTAPSAERTAAPTELAKLIAERDALPPNSPMRAVYEQQIRKITTHQPPVQVSYGSPVAGVGPDGKPVFFQPTKDGSPPAIIPGVRPPGDAEKPFTEGQAKAVAFASRMQSADQTLAELARKGVRTTVPGAMGNNAVGSTITAISSPEQQQLAQAKRDFVNAVLRRESGAVISDEEFANAERQYFPQIGDSRQVIEQKARNRRIAIEGMSADIPSARRGIVNQIANPQASQDDPLGLRGGK